MKKITSCFLSFLFIPFVSINAVKDFTQFVNPFIGTLLEGHTFPGATSPMGMVQASPESYGTYYKGYEGYHVAGYQYNDPFIWGFTQTHLNGVGCPSLSDILLMPFCNRVIDPSDRANFRSSFDKANEQATPGYYAVLLNDNHVKVELTTDKHYTYHRYTFEDSKSAQLLIDLQYGVRWDMNSVSDNVLEASQTVEDDYTISGYRQGREWARRKLFYVIRFNKKIQDAKTLTPPSSKEKAPRYLLHFDMKNDLNLEVMIGVSTTSIENAKKNLKTEQMGWGTFDQVKTKTNQEWNAILSKVEVKGDKDEMISFYTSLYHMYIQPNNIADVNGQYRAENDSIYQASSGKYYSTLSLWDTYRAAHPFYTILHPQIAGEIIASMMDNYSHKSVDKNNPKESNKYLPRWGLWGQETHTMIANHAIPVMVDAYLKGIQVPNYTKEQVYEAINTTATKPHYRNHTQLIDQYGYIPYDVQLSTIDDSRETVSRLLEGSYDDYCAGLYAKTLNLTDDTNFFMKRSQYYRNVYNPETGFMAGRNANGEFKKNVNPADIDGEWVAESDFTEGNSWHYLFHVQQDVPGMIQMMGGPMAVSAKLDSMFSPFAKPICTSSNWSILGTIGQYWHGNEPCHHVPYLYKFTDKPYKTDVLIKKVVDEYYENKPDGLKGNDDCGQMSAWYVFSCMGFYPVNPCGGDYVLGAPQLSYASLDLPNGKKFTMEAKNLSDPNCYVKVVKLNGKILDKKFITHQEIMNGGKLEFEMGALK